MKVGYKCLCKNSKLAVDYNLISSNFYIVKYVDTRVISIFNDEKCVVTFSLESEYSAYFYNYFYTKQEERKFKLEKLNESR